MLAVFSFVVAHSFPAAASRQLTSCTPSDRSVRTRNYSLGNAALPLLVVAALDLISIATRSVTRSCYRTVLEQAVARGIRSLCYCCVSTGIYGYPPRAAAHVALKTVREWLEAEEDADNIDLVVFCTFLDSDLRIYRELMPLYFPRVDRADPIEPESGEETKQATRGSDESSPEASVEESDNTAGISGEEKEAISATGAAEPMEMSDLPEQKRPRSEAGETTSQDDGVPMQRASESSRGDAASEPAGAAPGGDSQQASSEHADQPGGEVTGQTQQTDGERTKEA